MDSWARWIGSAIAITLLIFLQKKTRWNDWGIGFLLSGMITILVGIFHLTNSDTGVSSDVGIMVFLFLFGLSCIGVGIFINKKWPKIKSGAQKQQQNIQTINENKAANDDNSNSTLKYLNDKTEECIFCGSANIIDNVANKAKNEMEIKSLGYSYLWKSICLDCRKEWFWKE